MPSTPLGDAPKLRVTSEHSFDFDKPTLLIVTRRELQEAESGSVTPSFLNEPDVVVLDEGVRSGEAPDELVGRVIKHPDHEIASHYYPHQFADHEIIVGIDAWDEYMVARHRDREAAQRAAYVVVPFAIGSLTWPGLAKLAEECGELIQVIGKIMAFPEGEHPDGAGELRERLISEIGDVEAATLYVTRVNELSGVVRRRDAKSQLFWGWHEQERADG